MAVRGGILLALFTLAFAPLPAPAATAGATGTVVGWVRDSLSGRALCDAIVGVQGTHVGTEADSSGWFRLTGVPVGERVIQVVALGFRRGRVRIRVRPALSDTVRFRLSADPNAFLEVDTIWKPPVIPKNR